GLVLNGGYALADIDFGRDRSQVASAAAPARPASAADVFAPAQSKSSWAQDMFRFPDVTGAVDSDKQKADKPEEKAAAPKAGEGGAPPSVKPPDTKPPDAKPSEAKPSEAKPPGAKPAEVRGGGTVIPLDGNGGGSPGERAILERLGE